MNNRQTTFNTRNIVIVNIIALMLMLAGSAYVWMQTPAGTEIPVHFDASGTPDRYGSKAEGLLMLPAITILLSVLMSQLPRFEPRKSNLAQSEKVYKVVWALLIAVMVVVHAGVLASVLGYNLKMEMVVPIVVGFMLMAIGNYMGKMRSTWFMGIRTPWTLTSELSWNKTHRLGGRMFIVLGLSLMLAAFTQTQLWAGIIGVGTVAMVIFLFVYSYMVWKQDPAAQQS